MSSNDNVGGGATMDPAVKANAFRELLAKRAAGETPDPKLWNQFVAAQVAFLATMLPAETINLPPKQ